MTETGVRRDSSQPGRTGGLKENLKPYLSRLALLAAVLVLVAAPLAGCGEPAGPPTAAQVAAENPQYAPDFEAPAEKMDELDGGDFTEEMYAEAQAYEPLLAEPGTQVNMGFYSAKGNHGSLVRLLDSINGDLPPDAPPQEAIWDEGATSSLQYPVYDEMLEEHWYERAYPEDGKVTIYGKAYTDPHPVTPQQADDIWGEYSQRYTDMAALIRARTGKPVKAWCYVQGAKANRIFYKYELPELKRLEASGDVQVFFALSQDADWTDPADWIQGAANAPVPAQ